MIRAKVPSPSPAPWIRGIVNVHPAAGGVDRHQPQRQRHHQGHHQVQHVNPSISARISCRPALLPLPTARRPAKRQAGCQRERRSLPQPAPWPPWWGSVGWRPYCTPPACTAHPRSHPGAAAAHPPGGLQPQRGGSVAQPSKLADTLAAMLSMVSPVPGYLGKEQPEHRSKQPGQLSCQPGPPHHLHHPGPQAQHPRDGQAQLHAAWVPSTAAAATWADCPVASPHRMESTTIPVQRIVIVIPLSPPSNHIYGTCLEKITILCRGVHFSDFPVFPSFFALSEHFLQNLHKLWLTQSHFVV